MTKLDPQLRPTLRSQIMNVLYQAEQQRAQEELYAIIDANGTLANSDFPGFIYFGRMYFKTDATSVKEYGKAHKLNPTLHARMDSWLANQFVVVKEEMVIVTGFITAVLNTSNSPYDWLKLLPAVVHRPIIGHINEATFSQIGPVNPAVLTQDQVDTFLSKQERFLNMLKGRLALNLLM